MNGKIDDQAVQHNDSYMDRFAQDGDSFMHRSLQEFEQDLKALKFVFLMCSRSHLETIHNVLDEELQIKCQDERSKPSPELRRGMDISRILEIHKHRMDKESLTPEFITQMLIADS